MWTLEELRAADPGGDVSEAAATLNAQTITQTVDTPIAAVEGYMLTHGVLAKADGYAAAAYPDVNVLGVVVSLRGLIASPRLTVVQMSDPTTNAIIRQMLGALVAVGVMTASERDEVVAMSVSVTPKWRPAVGPLDLETARAS